MVGVMGSGSEPHRDLALPLGAWLASRGVHLLTGGGGGVMASVSEGFASVGGRRGLVLGVLPAAGRSALPPPGYPNRWVEIAIRTHLPQRGEAGGGTLSRNHINVLTADIVIVLPGGPGTASEARLSLRYGRPVVAFDREPDRRGEAGGRIPVRRDLRGVAEFVDEALARLPPPAGRGSWPEYGSSRPPRTRPLSRGG